MVSYINGEQRLGACLCLPDGWKEGLTREERHLPALRSPQRAALALAARPHPELRRFCFSIYNPGTFQDAALALELRARVLVCEQLCVRTDQEECPRCQQPSCHSYTILLIYMARSNGTFSMPQAREPGVGLGPLVPQGWPLVVHCCLVVWELPVSTPCLHSSPQSHVVAFYLQLSFCPASF